MTSGQKQELRTAAVETAIYAVLVVIFSIGVYHFWAKSLAVMAHHHRVAYACAALGLMVAQGLVLEVGARLASRRA